MKLYEHIDFEKLDGKLTFATTYYKCCNKS